MAREVEIAGQGKALAECTLVEIEQLAAGAEPGIPGRTDVTQESAYARLAEEMRAVHAETAADLGSEKVERWEVALGLGYIGGDDVFRHTTGIKSEDVEEGEG